MVLGIGGVEVVFPSDALILQHRGANGVAV